MPECAHLVVVVWLAHPASVSHCTCDGEHLKCVHCMKHVPDSAFFLQLSSSLPAIHLDIANESRLLAVLSWFQGAAGAGMQEACGADDRRVTTALCSGTRK